MNVRLPLAAVALACVSTLAAAQAGPGPGPRVQGGEGRGPGAFMSGSPLYTAVESLNLSDDQRAKLAVIRGDEQRKVQAGMGAMRELRLRPAQAADPGAFDEAAERKRYDAEAAARKAVFEARLESRSRIEAMLTAEQRQQLHQKLSRTPPPRAGSPAPSAPPSSPASPPPTPAAPAPRR